MTQTTADPIAGTARSADGTTIAYDRFDAATARSPGDGGPPVVMVHAAGGYRDFASMRSLAEVLAAEIPVVTYDRRGRGGRSGEWHGVGDADLAAALTGFFTGGERRKASACLGE